MGQTWLAERLLAGMPSSTCRLSPLANQRSNLLDLRNLIWILINLQAKFTADADHLIRSRR